MNTKLKFNKVLLPLIVLSGFSSHAHASVDLVVLDRLGEDVCRTGYRPLFKSEAEIYKNDLLKTMTSWQITGLEGNWVIMGSSYRGEIKQESNSTTFCYPINTDPFFATDVVLEKLGEDICRSGYVPVDRYEAQMHKDEMLKKMGSWQITGLKDNWVMMGPSYRGVIKQDYANSQTFCRPITPNLPEKYPEFDHALSAKFYNISGSSVNLDSEREVFNLLTDSLQDGIYLVDKGHGWVRGEEDFIEKGYASNGNTVAIETAKSIYSSHSVKISGGVGIKTGSIEAMIKQGYGREWRSIGTTTVNYRFTADADKLLYARVYATHQRIDTIEVKSKRIVSVTSSYTPTGSFGKKLSYQQGEFIDEYLFNENQGERLVTDDQTDASTALKFDSSKSYLYRDKDGREITENDLRIAANDISVDDINYILKVDENGYLIDSTINVNELGEGLTSSSRTNLSNGYYVIDLGEHWIREDDEGIIYTLTIPENTTGTYSESVTTYVGQSIETSLSAKLAPYIVQTVLEARYGHSWAQGNSTRVSVGVSSQSNQNSFTKIYSVNDRVDIIQVLSGNVIARTSTYHPNSYVAKDVKYAKNENLDQTKFYNTEPTHLLGYSSTEGGGFINYGNFFNFDVGMLTLDKPKTTAYFKLRTDLGWKYDFGVIFTVPETGQYNIGYFSEFFVRTEGQYGNYHKMWGWNANYEIWELNPDNSGLGIRLVAKTLGEADLLNVSEWLYPDDFYFITGSGKNNLVRNQILEKGKRYSLVVRNFSYLEMDHNYTRYATNVVATKLRDVNYDYDYKIANFYVNGGTPIEERYILPGSTIFSQPHSYRENYYLEGWYTDSALNNKFVFGVTAVPKDSQRYFSLYAKWVRK